MGGGEGWKREVGEEREIGVNKCAWVQFDTTLIQR